MKREERYAAAMQWFSTGPGLEARHLVDGYDWASLGEAIVVDIGGSYGHFSIAMAERHPDLFCVVQDRAEVVKTGQLKLPAHLEDRVSFMEYNFFEEQPVRKAAVYLLRWILHDWSDAYAIRILRALIPALGPRSKIVICELVLPQPGTVSAFRDRGFR